MATKTSKQDNTGTASKKKYVVTRNGIRVSEFEYDSMEETSHEVAHWNKILKTWPDGTHITVEEYNDKKHKIY